MLLVKFKRLENGLSIRELAYHSGVTPAEISMIETGRLRASAQQLARLALALNVTPPQRLLHEVCATDVGIEERVPA